VAGDAGHLDGGYGAGESSVHQVGLLGIGEGNGEAEVGGRQVVEVGRDRLALLVGGGRGDGGLVEDDVGGGDDEAVAVGQPAGPDSGRVEGVGDPIAELEIGRGIGDELVLEVTGDDLLGGERLA
jgi:hypothetical protein